MSASPNTTTVAARLTGIEKSFGKSDSLVHVLKGSSLEVPLGEMQLLIGPSGCGKTTLLSVLCGTLIPDAGEVEVFGQPLHQMKSSAVTKFRGSNIGFVFQQFNLIPTLSITENVAVPLLINGVSTREAERRAKEVLQRVGLGERTGVKPNKLSGGQQQRVAIARALVHGPRLMVCDEPTSALDKDTGLQIMELIREIANDANRAVIIVTHDPRVYKYADRIAEMEDGRILRETIGKSAIHERYLSAPH
jgi:putative ABC transport system ATP-binding protein